MSILSPTTAHGVANTLPPPPPLPTPSSQHTYLTNLGLGYAIAIAFGFLVLLSSLFLASYLCFRQRQRYHHHRHPTTADDGIILPSIIFVAEGDEDTDDSQNIVVGLDQIVINSYPRFPFAKGGGNRGGVGNDSVCPICLCEYKDSEMLRMLPDCKHYFHLTCIDAWLKLNASCPVCRNSPLPTPLSTPLAEVVPLSHYSDGRRRR